MDLDRHLIERKDFTVARRGYDQQEVDLHLRELADTVAELRAELRATPAGIAGAAAEQVRQIVEAAEESAAEIERRATDEATRVTEDASKRARETRERADADSAEQLGKVQETAKKMLDRAATLEEELDTLVDGIRDAAGSLVQRIRESTGELEAELDSIRGELTAIRPPEPIEAAGPIEDYDEIDEEEDEETELAARGSLPSAAERVIPPSGMNSDAGHETVASQQPEIADPEPAAGPAPGVGGGGPEGARLVALNMALNGTPREEAARYLADNFQLDDQDSILDDVYSRVGGRN
jgi:DivIVA domain-containing protein